MSWDDEAATWDDSEPVRAYARGAWRSLQEVCAERGVRLEGARVLDFGCGTGLLTEQVAPQAGEVVALDVSAAMLEVLQGKGLDNVRTVLGELADAVGEGALAAGTFDLVVCSSVCAFVPDYPATTALLAGLLAPSGLFVQWDWELDPVAEEPMGLSREAVREALEGAGLRDVTIDVGFREPFEDVVMAPLRGVGRRSAAV